MEDFYGSLKKFKEKPSQTATFIENLPNETVQKKTVVPQRSTGYAPPIPKQEKKILKFAQPLDVNGEYPIMDSNTPILYSP